MPKQGYEQMDGGDGGGQLYDDRPESPASFDEIERPPLRHIDKYMPAQCPCLSARFTIATMTCIGFIISFGMRCNMGMAKLQFENVVSMPISHSIYCFIIEIIIYNVTLYKLMLNVR